MNSTVVEIKVPKWMRDLKRLLGVRRQFVFEGNVRDTVLVPPYPGERLPFAEALRDELQRCGYRLILHWNPVTGLAAYPMTRDTIEMARAIPGLEKLGDDGRLELLSTVLLAQLITRLGTPEQAPAGAALVVDYASRIRQNATGLTADEHYFFLASEKAANEAQPMFQKAWGDARFNPVVWLCNRAQDLPSWFLVDNPGVHTITVGLPDADTRFAVALQETRALDEGAEEPAVREAASLMASRTEGMPLAALKEIGQLARNESMKLGEIDRAVKMYQVGDPAKDDPWRGGALRDKIRSADKDAVLSNRVKGQHRAVVSVLDMLKRIAFGLTGAHSRSSPTRPKGVMFFAGPTGVGKTEMSKAIAQVVFGDENAMLRFDMSEFTSEHSDARLIGAPPGYIGYDTGGQLTDALREKPFRVILFDEIEKAHPRILDKFLQILEDGRLTDGRGETVYFSESIIIFTSNLGVNVERREGDTIVRKPNVESKDSYDEVKRKIKEAIVSDFRFRLNRPELLNRIGEDNIVVFGFIGPEAGREIFRDNLARVVKKLEEDSGISVDVEAIKGKLEAHCLEDLDGGGRGIGARLEAAFTNSLTRALFDVDAKAGSAWSVTEWTKDVESGVFSVKLQDKH